MSAVAGHVAWALVFLAIGVAVALAVALPQRASATHDAGISYMERGLFPYSALNCENYRDDPNWSQYWVPDSHPCWHDDEPGDRKAIDFNIGTPTAGQSIYFYYLGDSQHFKIDNIPYPTPCTGVAVAIYEDFVGNETFRRGEINYLHIDPRDGIVGDIASSFEWLGGVSASQPAGCLTTGPHLHQSADTSGSTPFYYNRWGDPEGDMYQQHTIYWDPSPGDSDDDNDEFTDIQEIRMSTDPGDPCADSSTPSDERGFHYFEDISPWPPDANDDRDVDMGDVIILFLGKINNPEAYRSRSDFDGDGDIDIGDVLNGFYGRIFATCP